MSGMVASAAAVLLVSALWLRAAEPEWSFVTYGGGGMFTGVECSPLVPDLMLLKSDVGGPWRRTAPGDPWTVATWRQVTPGPIWGCNAIAFHPTDADTVLAEVGLGGAASGLYRSRDRGRSWQLVLAKWSHANSGAGGDEKFARKWRTAIAWDPRDPRVVWWGTMKDGLWRSLDGGDTWTQARAPLADEPSPGIRCVVVDGRTALSGRSARIVISIYGKGLWQSQDAGATFAADNGFAALPGPPLAVRTLRLGGDGTLYAAHERGLARHDGAWTDISPLPSTLALAVDPHDPRRIAVASTGHKAAECLWRSTDRGTTWTAVTRTQVQRAPGGPVTTYHRFAMASTAIDLDPHRPGVAYLSDSYSVWRIDDLWQAAPLSYAFAAHGAENVVPLHGCAPPANTAGTSFLMGCSDVSGMRLSRLDQPALDCRNGSTHHFNTGYDYCEVAPHVVYLSACDYEKGSKLSRSDDGGATWRATALPTTLQGAAAKVAVSATDPDRVVWAPAYNEKVRFTTDGGATWTLATRSDTGAAFAINPGNSPYHSDDHVAADRVDGRTFYLFQIAGDATGSHFWRSRDGGATWSPSTTVLRGRGGANAFVAPVMVQAAPGRAGEVWLSRNSSGLWRSTDFGATFTRVEFFEGSQFLAFGFGKERPGAPADRPSLWVWAKKAGETTHGLWLSDDLGTSWSRHAPPVANRYARIWPSRQTWGRVFMSGPHGFLTAQLVSAAPPAISGGAGATPRLMVLP